MGAVMSEEGYVRPADLAPAEKADLQSHLELWKACVELHKWHDNLKQTRIARFTAVQIALAGGFGVTVREVLTCIRFFGPVLAWDATIWEGGYHAEGPFYG